MVFSFSFLSSRNATQSSLSSSVTTVPRASWCGEWVSGRTAKVPPAEAAKLSVLKVRNMNREQIFEQFETMDEIVQAIDRAEKVITI